MKRKFFLSFHFGPMHIILKNINFKKFGMLRNCYKKTRKLVKFDRNFAQNLTFKHRNSQISHVCKCRKRLLRFNPAYQKIIHTWTSPCASRERWRPSSPTPPSNPGSVNFLLKGNSQKFQKRSHGRYRADAIAGFLFWDSYRGNNFR